MGNVFAEITVTNKEDIIKAKNGIIAEKDVRSVTMKALVDTGATTLIINDEICRQLGLGTIGTRTANLAGGGKGFCKVTESVQIQWKDRFATVDAIAFPEDPPCSA
jgi:predicted aspartyl protease